MEQQAHVSNAQIELERLGLRRVALGQAGRLLVGVITGNGIHNKQFREPVFRDGAGNVYGDFWAPDKFGSRYVGGRTVTPTAQVSNLRVPDAPGNAPGKPRPAFE